MNEGFGEDFHRKGYSVKRSGPFSEPPDSETDEKLRCSHPLLAENQLLFTIYPKDPVILKILRSY